MAKSCIIIHDSYSSPAELWIIDLSAQMRARGYAVYIPTFPTPVGQEYERWRGILEPYRAYIGSETVLVGVGVGATMMLRFVETLSTPVSQTILLAPFAERLPNSDDNLLVSTFVAEPFPWQKISQYAGVISVVGSSDDPVVPVSYVHNVANALGGKVLMLDSRGHFRQSNGVERVPEILNIIDARGIAAVSPSVVTPGVIDAIPLAPTVSEPTENVAPAPVVPVYEPPTHARTLRSDFASALSGASTAEMAHVLSEYRSGHERVVIQRYERVRKIILMLIGTVCLIGGIAAIFWMLKTTLYRPEVVEVQELPLHAQSIADVPFALSDTAEVIQTAVAESLPDTPPDDGGLHVVRFRQSDTTSPSAQTFFKTIEPDIPTTFTNTLQAPFVLGYMYTGGMWKPFAVFAVEKFEQANRVITDWDDLFAPALVKLFTPKYARLVLKPEYVTEFQSRTRSNRDVTVFVLRPKQTEPVPSESETAIGAPVNETVTTVVETETTSTTTGESKPREEILFLTPEEIQTVDIAESSLTLKNPPARFLGLQVGDVVVIPATPGIVASDDMRVVSNITTEGDTTVFATATADPLTVFSLLQGIPIEGALPVNDTQSSERITGPTDVFGYTFVNDRYLVFVTDTAMISPIADRLLKKL